MNYHFFVLIENRILARKHLRPTFLRKIKFFLKRRHFINFRFFSVVAPTISFSRELSTYQAEITAALEGFLF